MGISSHFLAQGDSYMYGGVWGWRGRMDWRRKASILALHNFLSFLEELGATGHFSRSYVTLH